MHGICNFQITTYCIDSAQYRPNDARLFELDSVTRTLKLTTQLDREEIDNHQIRIIPTNSRDGPPQNPKESDMLIVNISVCFPNII